MHRQTRSFNTEQSLGLQLHAAIDPGPRIAVNLSKAVKLAIEVLLETRPQQL